MSHKLTGLFIILLAACNPVSGPAKHQFGDRLAFLANPTNATYRAITWEDLVPKGWQPMADLDTNEIAGLVDSDPRAIEILGQMREAWDKAPVVAELDGQTVRIAGFLVPLDAERNQVREFLLVPYFGACIHTPPPPANQTLHVVMDHPFEGSMMEAFWISGRLSVARSDSPFGPAAYTLQGRLAEAYKRPGQP